MSKSEFALDLGNKLFESRAAMRLTQADVARAAEVTQATVARWEKGICMPDAFQVVQLKAFFKAERERRALSR